MRIGSSGRPEGRYPFVDQSVVANLQEWVAPSIESLSRRVCDLEEARLEQHRDLLQVVNGMFEMLKNTNAEIRRIDRERTADQQADVAKSPDSIDKQSLAELEYGLTIQGLLLQRLQLQFARAQAPVWARDYEDDPNFRWN